MVYLQIVTYTSVYRYANLQGTKELIFLQHNLEYNTYIQTLIFRMHFVKSGIKDKTKPEFIRN